MKISELLLEYNEQRLINDFGANLLKHTKLDDSAPKTNEPKELITAIAALDPTPNKDLTFWLAFQYSKFSKTNNSFGIKRWEDIGSRAIPALIKFKALSRKPNLEPKLPTKDINQVQGLGVLEDILDNYEEKEATSNKELSNQEEENFYKSGQAELLHNDSNIKVVIPKSKKAAQFFGINTKWCTAAKENNMFAYYNKKGRLYIVLIKKENKRFQFHFQTGQFMDGKDREIKPNKLADKYPILWKIFTPIAEKLHSVILNAHPSEAFCMDAVKRYAYAIKYIKNPSEALCIAAVKKDGVAIKYIKNPSEALCMAAIKQNAFSIEYIKNPSEAVCLAAVQHSGGDAIEYIKNIEMRNKIKRMLNL